jgi:hypothetical protein
MPGEKALLQEFVQQQFLEGERPVFGFLLEQVFDQMKLAGEAGSLLRIEESIQTSVSAAKRRWQEGPQYEQSPLFPEATARPGQGPMQLDLSGITDGQFWDRAEHRIYDALRDYSEKAENDLGFQRRLFANDAAQGFAFVDLCRARYDVVVMNPPFGDPTRTSVSFLQIAYPLGWQDLFRAFVERMPGMLSACGLVGSVGPRPPLYLVQSADWRSQLLLKRLRLYGLADLGIGVLDDALVEACAYLLTTDSRTTQPFFIRAIKTRDKAATVLAAVADPLSYAHRRLFFTCNLTLFASLPQCAIAYWVSLPIAALFATKPRCEGVLGEARVGLQTSDDFRFVRARWEVPESSMFDTWFPLAKGGEYSPFYSDIHLVTKWLHDGREVCAFNEELYGSASRNVRSADRYFELGITWSPRTTTEFAPRVLPRDCIFGQKGPALLTPTAVQAAAALAVTNCRVFQYLVTICAGAAEVARGSSSKSYGVGLVQAIPVPEIIPSEVGQQAIRCFDIRREDASTWDVTCADFCGFGHPSADTSFQEWVSERVAAVFRTEAEVLRIWHGWDSCVTEAYGLPSSVQEEVLQEVGSVLGDAIFTSLDENAVQDPLATASREVDSFDTSAYGVVRRLAAATGGSIVGAEECVCQLARASGSATYRMTSCYVDYLVGVAFRRFSDERAVLTGGAFTRIAFRAPAQLQGATETPFEVLVLDEQHPLDLSSHVEERLRARSDRGDSHLEEMIAILGSPNLRAWIRSSFFDEHLRRHSKSRRQAPVYWPLSTPSCSYMLWLYYHRLSDQTLFKAVNDFVEPKLQQIASQAAALRGRGSRASADNAELERLSDFECELREFRDELLRLAKVWKPNLNDGVVITAAPLWKLFQYKPWQKKLKETWEALEAGEYDWAHLAYSLWPDRVREKCKHDKSLAIAHGLEALYQEPPATKGKKRGRKPKVADPELMEDAE